MIPRFRPLFGLREFAALRPTRRETAIARFEGQFAREFDVGFAVAFPYGRTALRLLLEALDIRDREVVCPAYTCVVVPHAIVASGNRPVFVDAACDANMDLAEAERAMTAATAAMIPTAIFGHPVDLDHLAQLRATRPDMTVIQDCAHAFRCEWQGRAVHKAGDAAIFGINVSKVMSSIYGGMVTTDDPSIAQRLRALRARVMTIPGASKNLVRTLYMLAAAAAFSKYGYAFTDWCRQLGLLQHLERYYDEAHIDMPADHLVGMSAVEAAVGAVQVERLGEFIAARRRYAAYYHAALADCPGLRFVPTVAGASFSHLAAVVPDRDALRRAAHARGVELGTIVDYCIPDMRAYRDLSGGRKFPRAEFLATHVVNLPLWGRFDAAVAARVAEVLRECLKTAPAAPAMPA